MFNNSFGLYVHIPFCESRCKYCSFYSTTKGIINEEKFLNSLLSNLKQFEKYNLKNIKTIYFGGGTPSILSPVFFEKFLKKIRNYYKVDKFAEITIEMNPEHVTLNKLIKLRKIGINRISMGIQALNDETLKKLNRVHSKKTAIDALELICENFENVSCDFIIGIKNNKLEIENILKFKLLSKIKHISIYILEGEKNQNLMENEDKINRKYLKLSETMEKLGFSHYEISNFCKKGYESKHNCSYWKGNNYIGIGPSAHSLIVNKNEIIRIGDETSLNDFLNCDFNLNTVNYKREEFIKELFMLMLRMSKGVNLLKFNKKYEVDYSKLSNSLKLKFPQLINLKNNIISLNKNGFLLSNEIFQEII